MAYDLSRVVLNIWIAAPPDEVFASWVDERLLPRWFHHEAQHTPGPVAATGSAYEWRMVHGHVSHGRYLEVEPGTRVRLTFGHDDGMTFTVRCEPDAASTLVHLVHEGIPDDAETHADIRAGWTFFLVNLKAWNEHGVDLREHDADRIRSGVLNI